MTESLAEISDRVDQSVAARDETSNLVAFTDTLENRMEDISRRLDQSQQSTTAAPLIPSEYAGMVIEQMQARINSLEQIVRNQATTIKSQQELLHKTIPDPTITTKPTINMSQTPVHPVQSPTPVQQNNMGHQEDAVQEATANAREDDSRVRKHKPHVFLLGDSMLGGLEYMNKEKPLSRSHFTSVKAHGGATSDDLQDFIKPVLRRKPNTLILHCGSNDFRNQIDTAKNIDNMICYAKRNNPEVSLAVSEICLRKDKFAPPIVSITDMNKRIENVCGHHGIPFIKQSDFGDRCLSKGQLHPNKYGNEMLLKAFINVFPNSE